MTTENYQPPSGGCVLKLALLITAGWYIYPAAFRRLCVETLFLIVIAIKAVASRLQAAVC